MLIALFMHMMINVKLEQSAFAREMNNFRRSKKANYGTSVNKFRFIVIHQNPSKQMGYKNCFKTN